MVTVLVVMVLDGGCNVDCGDGDGDGGGDVYHGRQTELLEALDEERSSCIIKASSALP